MAEDTDGVARNIAESAWMTIVVRFVLPAAMTILMTVGTYEVSAFRGGSERLNARMEEVVKQIHDLNTHLVQRDGDVMLINQSLKQLQHVEEDHEARMRVLEKKL